jgi:hypothetical protein
MAAEETDAQPQEEYTEGEEKELSEIEKENPPDRPEVEEFVTEVTEEQ